MANKHYTPAACFKLCMAGASTFLLPFSHSFLECTFHKAQSFHPCSPVGFSIPVAPNPFPIITPSQHPLPSTSYSPLSFSALPFPSLLSLVLPPPSRGVMPSLAREPKPRCLCWLLLETRSCRARERESERERERGGESETRGWDETEGK